MAGTRIRATMRWLLGVVLVGLLPVTATAAD